MKQIRIKQRQMDTILAALRHWQQGLLFNDCMGDEMMIAEDHGDALTPDEIDDLAEVLNG